MQVPRFQHAISPEAQRILVSHPDRIFAQADARRSTAAVRPEQNSNAAESSARGCGSKAFQKWRDGWQIFVKRACTNNEDVHRLNVNTRSPARVGKSTHPNNYARAKVFTNACASLLPHIFIRFAGPRHVSVVRLGAHIVLPMMLRRCSASNIANMFPNEVSLCTPMEIP